MSGNLRAGIWRLADPKISLASFASLFLGGAAAAAGGTLDWGWLAVTVGGIFALEVAKNASGEVYDYDSGTDLAVAAEDRSPFSGGKRVLVDGLLSRRALWVVALISYGLAIAAGLTVVLLREPRVLALGIIGVGCAFFYHAPPLRLSYRGLGEAAVALCYGPLIACGTYLVQRGGVSPMVWLPALPLGLLIGGFLLINEFPDYRADLAAGKRTLVVRLGRERASGLFALVLGAAFAGVMILPLLGVPRGVWLGAFAILPAILAATALRAAPTNTARIIPAQGRTLLAFVLYALGAGLGLLYG